VKAELIKAQRVAVDEDSDVLVWTGSHGRSPAPGGDEEHVLSALQAAPPRAQPADHTIAIDRSPAQRGISEAERRQLTVLFCDLVDSTTLAAHLYSLMVASRGIGLLSLRQGELLRALPRLERAVSLVQDEDLPIYLPRMAAALGAAYTLGGRVADAMPLLTQALEQTTKGNGSLSGTL
jgi:hypothetical protein